MTSSYTSTFLLSSIPFLLPSQVQTVALRLGRKGSSSWWVFSHIFLFSFWGWVFWCREREYVRMVSCISGHDGLHDPPALAVTVDIGSNRTHDTGSWHLPADPQQETSSPLLTLCPSQQGCDATSPQVHMHLRNRAHCESFLILTLPSAVCSHLKGEGTTG